MDPPVVVVVDDEDLLKKHESRNEYDLESHGSAVSSLFGTEDCRSSFNSSSCDLSGTSSSSSSNSSGDIPAVVVAAAAAVADVVVVTEPVPAMEVATANVDGDGDGEVVVREGCVGKKNKGVSWGSASVIGRRREMEDAIAVIPGFISRTCDQIGGCTAPGSRISGEIMPVHFFGVYDGHGGSQVAKFCAERIHEVVTKEWERGEGDGDAWRTRWETAFSNGFEQTDNQASEESIAPETVGSTAVVVAVSGCQIITSNCGDSRAVLCRGTKTIPLTVDHKPDREDELERIEGGGGRVINWNGARVFGVLAMSRAIGAHVSSFSQILFSFLIPSCYVLVKIILFRRTLLDKLIISHLNMSPPKPSCKYGVNQELRK